MAANFRWNEEYCKAVKRYLDNAQRTSKGRLKRGEIDRIASTLGIAKNVLSAGIKNPATTLNRYLQTGVYSISKTFLTEDEIKVLADFVIEHSDNLQHAFRCTAIYYRENRLNKKPVNSISVYYYTHMKHGETLFNLISQTEVFGSNVKNNLVKGATTIGVF